MLLIHGRVSYNSISTIDGKIMSLAMLITVFAIDAERDAL